MYTPSSFKETDPKTLFDFIEANSFGILFSQHGDRAEATHLPFLVDRNRDKQGVLIAHFAKANKHWRRISTEQDVLCVFHGMHGYITPAWYHDRVTVPTWNYASVHVTGTPTIIDDPEWLRKAVVRLTHFHEAHTESDWDLSEGESTIPVELKAIIGLEIEITHIEGKFKFNQNRSTEDQHSVIEHAKRHPDEHYKQMGAWMGQNLADKKETNRK
ncbi:MAG: FMN-binding negative transcriptional regulator [Bacteroidota bacterium]